MANEANCLCRHAEHHGTPCFWQSPGGDLVGQSCDCAEYEPCPHPADQRGSNSSGNPVCGRCNQHFSSYAEWLGAKIQSLPASAHIGECLRGIKECPGPNVGVNTEVCNECSAARNEANDAGYARDQRIWVMGGISGAAESSTAAYNLMSGAEERANRVMDEWIDRLIAKHRALPREQLIEYLHSTKRRTTAERVLLAILTHEEP